MTIEFQTQPATVSDQMLNFLREEIMKLTELNKEISRAEVILREDERITVAENKLCEIRLTVYGDDLLARSYTDNFNTSAQEVLKELNKLVKKQAANKNEPPDITTSTIEVK